MGISAHERFLNSRYFGALDGLRCISILAVIWHHTGPHAYHITTQGHRGVDLFFAISGFLITTLLLRERDQHGRISLANFYVRRSLRIFPLYYVVLLVYVVLVGKFEHNAEDRAEFFRRLPWYATYTSNWLIDGLFIGRKIFHFAWSLATEEQFYLVWPWVVAFSRSWKTPLVVMSAAVVVDQVMEGMIYAGAFPPPYPMWVRVVSGIATPICLGCILAILIHIRRGFDWLHPILGNVWSVAGIVVLMVGTLFLPETLVPTLLLHVLMACLVVAVCLPGKKVLGKMLSNRVVRYVGMISYGMYLLHMIGMQLARRVPGVKDHGNGAAFVAATLITLVLATGSYWTFERWILKLKDRFRPEPAGGAGRGQHPVLPGDSEGEQAVNTV
ncbi:MAG TPA: acyltransferase [Tepidisphaeraceae bacterium]